MKEEEVIRIKDRLEKIGEHLKSQDDLGPDLSAQFDEIRQKLEKAVELHDQGQYNALGEDLRIFEGSIEVYLEENPDAGKTAKEWLAEAQRNEGIGEREQAKEAHEKYFAFKEPYLDPYLSYIGLLKSFMDDEKARSTYRALMEASDNLPAAKMAYAYLLDREQKIEYLRDFIKTNEDYVPAYFEILLQIQTLSGEAPGPFYAPDGSELTPDGPEYNIEMLKRNVGIYNEYIAYFEKLDALEPKPNRVSISKLFVDPTSQWSMSFGLAIHDSDPLNIPRMMCESFKDIAKQYENSIEEGKKALILQQKAME